jgi:hypothetical protein
MNPKVSSVFSSAATGEMKQCESEQPTEEAVS